MVSSRDIATAIAEMGVAERPVCLHSSLSSFGRVEGGAGAVVDAFLDNGCTLMVPSFSWQTHSIWPPPAPSELRPARNGLPYEWGYRTEAASTPFSPDSNVIDRVMGAIAAAVVDRPGRARGDHPLCSFAAVGPAATELVSGQAAQNVYAPFDALVAASGVVIMAGVGLKRMTLLHHAEQAAGRRLFQRYALRPDGTVGAVQSGGCSEGFEQLAPALAPIETSCQVGRSGWRVFPAEGVLMLAAAAIRAEPAITRCADPWCTRCIDAIAGGPEMAEVDDEPGRGIGTPGQ